MANNKMKLTHSELLSLYLNDLSTIDPTCNRQKSLHPQHWNRDSWYKNEPLIFTDILNCDRDIWMWSDIHWFHKNILKYSNRPYPTVELMNECLLGNAQRVIKPNDILIWGGDISFGHIETVNKMIEEIPAYHVHIIGNHDMDKQGKITNYHMDERHPCLVLDVIDAEIEYQLLLTHYPLDHIPVNCFSVHGHTHQHPEFTNKHINYCVEHINYTPVNIKQIIKDTNQRIKAAYEYR